MTKIRPTGIFVSNDKILLMRRIRENKEYFVFPGGHIEIGESVEDTLKREMKEELNFDIFNFKEIFRIKAFDPRDNCDAEHVFYLISDFGGELGLGGPELERMKKGDNKYYPTWYNKSEFEKLDPIYPIGIKEFILKIL